MSDTTPRPDPIQVVHSNTTPVFQWPPLSIEAEIRAIKVRIIYVLVVRKLVDCDGHRPLPTCWPGEPDLDLADDTAVRKFAAKAAREYCYWLDSKDGAPVSRLGEGQQSDREIGGTKVTPKQSKEKGHLHDCMRLAITCTALSGWRAFTNLEGLHHSLDIFDGVFRTTNEQQQDVFMRRRSRALSDDERRAVSDLASGLSHSKMFDVLQVAANYCLTYADLKNYRDPEAATLLRQRRPIGLTTDDQVIARLTEKVDGRPSVYEGYWFDRVVSRRPLTSPARRTYG